MSNIPPIEDGYIDEVIKSSGPLKPNLNKTQGIELRALVKLLRNRLETEIADHYTESQAALSLKADTDQVILKSTQINGKPLSGNVTLDKNDIGLGNVDNTPDADKPLSSLAQTALGLKADITSVNDGLSTKVDKVLDKQLSTEDFSTGEKNKLGGLQDGATANQSDSYLLERNNHTGSQDINTINGLLTELDAKIKLSEKGVANGVATLDVNGKIPSGQLSEAILGSVNYQGNYDASANNPPLSAASGNKGKYYIIAVAGNQQGLELNIGDWIISNGEVWQKVDNSTDVVSVNGMTGVVNVTDISGNAGTSTVSQGIAVYNPNLEDTVVLEYNQGSEGYLLRGLNEQGNGSLSIDGNLSANRIGAKNGSVFNAPTADDDILRLGDVSAGKTIGANTTGNAGSATKWAGLPANFGTHQLNPPNDWLLGFNGLSVGAFNATTIKTWLGIPSAGINLQSITDVGNTTTNALSAAQITSSGVNSGYNFNDKTALTKTWSLSSNNGVFTLSNSVGGNVLKISETGEVIANRVSIVSPNVAEGTSNLNAKALLTISGGRGGDNMGTEGTVQAGNAGDVNITGANGGNATGNTTGYAIGGRGASVLIRSGDGGLAVGNTAIGGLAGSLVFQAGTAYNKGIAGSAEIKGGSAAYPNGLGGSVYISPGAGNASSEDNQLYNGSIHLGVTIGGSFVRGNTIIGSVTDDRINRLQVAGRTKLSGDLEVTNQVLIENKPTSPNGAIRLSDLNDYDTGITTVLELKADRAHFSSGTYMPTATPTGVFAGIIDVITPDNAIYTRVGNVVTVNGSIYLQTTSAGQTSIRLSLPIASALTNSNDASGVGQITYTNNSFSGNVSVGANASNDQVLVAMNAPNGGFSLYYSYMYLIK